MPETKVYKQRIKRSHPLYNQFLHKLAYKCKGADINLYIAEESHTSGASFLDNEEPIKDSYP